MKRYLRLGILGSLCLALCGCETLYGYKIHAPGLLSDQYYQEMPVRSEVLALFVPPEVLAFSSKDKGSRFSDPQTYFIGEALGPMVLEAFQHSFENFIYFEVEPSKELMESNDISNLLVFGIKDFENVKKMGDQQLTLTTIAALYDQDLNVIRQFEAVGSSHAEGVFAKKGGPEVNLNAAIEQTIESIVLQCIDYFDERSGG